MAVVGFCAELVKTLCCWRGKNGSDRICNCPRCLMGPCRGSCSSDSLGWLVVPVVIKPYFCTMFASPAVPPCGLLAIPSCCNRSRRRGVDGCLQDKPPIVLANLALLCKYVSRPLGAGLVGLPSPDRGAEHRNGEHKFGVAQPGISDTILIGKLPAGITAQHVHGVCQNVPLPGRNENCWDWAHRAVQDLQARRWIVQFGWGSFEVEANMRAREWYQGDRTMRKDHRWDMFDIDSHCTVM